MSHHIPPKYPRAQAICVFYNNRKILVYEATDSVKKETFYRPLGGGIHFQEMGSDAVQREIMEELEQETKDIRYLGSLENIYTYEGEPGHEIVLIFDGKFKDEELNNMELIRAPEGPKSGYAIWKSIDDFVKKGQILCPDGLTELLKMHFK